MTEEKYKTIECICKNPECKKTFFVAPWDIKKGRGQHCCKKCQGRVRSLSVLRCDANGNIVEKYCLTCSLWLPTDNFTSRSKGTKLKSECRLCRSIYDLKVKYGLSDDLARLFATGQVRCIIRKCNERAVVDHCHTTGQYRMPLCQKHNTALGFCNEDPEEIEDLLLVAKYCQRVKER